MKKYDLTWIIDNMDTDFVRQEPELFIELVRCLKDELDRRKAVIKLLQNTIEDIL